MFIPILPWFFISFLVSSLFALLGVYFSNNDYNVDSNECFECGIDTALGARVPFAIHFFIVAVIFVLFDAEVILSLTFISPPLGTSNWWYWWMYLLMLFLGLVVEFFIQTVDWNE